MGYFTSPLLALALGGTVWAGGAVAAIAQSRPTPSADSPTLNQLRRSSSADPALAQTDQPSLPELPPEETLEETPEETLEETPEAATDAAPASSPELRTDPLFDAEDLPPEDLLADPNPLSFPAFTEEVEIERTDVITLEEAIELAYFNNPDLQTALLELERAQAAVDEAEAAFLPTVGTGADYTVREGGGSSVNIPGLGQIGGSGDLDGTLNGSIDISYDLFTSGRRVALLRAAEAQLRTSELEVERRQEVLRLTTANLYYDLQDATEQIRINQAFVESSSQNLRDSELRQEAGVGTRFDVLRAEVQFANARQALIQAQSQQRIAQRDLARLLNLPSTQNVQAAAVEQAEIWPLTLEESIILAFQNRAELEQQLSQREVALQQARAARSALGPQVSLFANYSLQDILDDSSDTYSFGARFNMTLYDGGAARARARQQERSADIAEQGFAQTLDQVRFDVEQAYFTLQANAENIGTARVAVEQAEEALRLAELRLANGVGTQLDVLNAESERTEAEGNLVSALLGYNRALAALQRAVSNLEATL